MTLVGRDRYLGKFGSIESRRAYQGLISEWVAEGCPKTIDRDHAANLTIKELILRYWQFVRMYYNPRTRNGTITSKRTITVKDILIVSLGDSFSSGEGNPEFSRHTLVRNMGLAILPPEVLDRYPDSQPYWRLIEHRVG